MPENKTIKNFTAADIEKYWNNKLSAAEMHEIEKAAMDDPFLADALEGYKHSNNINEELKLLQERFQKGFAHAKAPVIDLKHKRQIWLRVAAAIIIIAGGGLLIQQLIFKSQKSEAIVTANENDTKKAEAATTNNAATIQRIQSPIAADSPAAKAPQKIEPGVSDKVSNLSVKFDTIRDIQNLDAEVNVVDNKKIDQPAGDLSIAKSEKENETLKETSITRKAPDTIVGSFSNRSAAAALESKAKNKQGILADQYKQAYSLNNKYYYRVVDAQNNPVPFANITNTRDNVGTYTDIRGNFNLVSADSVLDVQVRSLGYNAANYRLVPTTQTNAIVLKEDATARMQMENSQGRKLVSSIARKDSAAIIEPEVGWGYYNTYAENNLRIPDNIRAKSTGSEVELSFDVDKTGQPINIKVTKSSQCKVCDEEAIRLLKEGPKWKRKGKRSKTTISIAVDQK